MLKIDKKKEKHMKRLLRIRNILNKDCIFWGILIVYSIIMALGIAYVTVWMPENWLTKFMDENVTLSGTLGVITVLALGVFIMLSYIKVLGKIDDEDKVFCEYISTIEGVTADEMMEIADKYKLNHMFYLALEKRLKELKITKVPPCCMDGWEIFRLPTKEDLNRN